jgi:hypothetical protein
VKLGGLLPLAEFGQRAMSFLCNPAYFHLGKAVFEHKADGKPFVADCREVGSGQSKSMPTG